MRVAESLISTHTTRRILKVAVFIASLSPFLFEAWSALTDRLGPHAYRIIINDTGRWSLWFITLTLALTPLRRVTSVHELVRYRRMLGLFAFFYSVIHTLTYVAFDRVAGLDLPVGSDAAATVAALTVSTVRDIWDKPFLATGFAAFALMVPLAGTSTSGMIRRLGGATWRRLHRLIYVVAAASLLHHWWPLSDRFRVDQFAVLIGLSLASRAAWLLARSSHVPAVQARPVRQSSSSI
jgi:methionine sulfoxide reductase heme-binding subunit